jgi:hypothetical protein
MFACCERNSREHNSRELNSHELNSRVGARALRIQSGHLFSRRPEIGLQENLGPRTHQMNTNEPRVLRAWFVARTFSCTLRRTQTAIERGQFSDAQSLGAETRFG